MNLAPVVHLMGRHYLQLEFLLTKIVWVSAASFVLWIRFFSSTHVQTTQMWSRRNSSSVPATCQDPTLACLHQKTNPWKWYLCGISPSPSTHPGAKNIPWLSNNWIGSQVLQKIYIKGGKHTAQRFWGDSSNFSFFPSQEPTTVMCWSSRKLEWYVKLCSASCIKCIYFKISSSSSQK